MADEIGNWLLTLLDLLNARIQDTDIIAWESTDLTIAAAVLMIVAQAKVPFHTGDEGSLWWLLGRVDEALVV